MGLLEPCAGSNGFLESKFSEPIQVHPSWLYNDLKSAIRAASGEQIVTIERLVAEVASMRVAEVALARGTESGSSGEIFGVGEPGMILVG